MIPAVSASTIQALLKTDQIRLAFSFFADHAAAITAHQIEICQIPAPPFNEQKRARYFRRKFIELGLRDAKIDAEGNVLALRRGTTADAPTLVVSAHLDTVFPLSTDLTPRFENTRIFAPGIMDDGCGLAALLALAEALETLKIETRGSILFVATVGEEGAGNLRGVRHLLTDGEFAKEIRAFISLDGAGVSQIVNRALGSRRYKVALAGGGGHSWLDAGAPNPVHAAGRIVSQLMAFRELSKKDKTTFNVGKIAGGTSVNSIPTTAEIEVDLRSESSNELQRLDAFFRRAVYEAVSEENSVGRKGYAPLELNLKLTGDRPSGETKSNHRLIRLAVEATQAVGGEPNLTISSTDANLPMSLDIPAITIGAGGAGDKMHTTSEWYDPTGREIGLNRALLLILGFVELS